MLHGTSNNVEQLGLSLQMALLGLWQDDDDDNENNNNSEYGTTTDQCSFIDGDKNPLKLQKI